MPSNRTTGVRIDQRGTAAHPHYGDPYRRHPESEILMWLRKNHKGTAWTIASALGYLHHNNVARWLTVLRRQGRIYVCDYERRAQVGPPREIYALRLNDEQDEPRPKPLTGTEKTNRYRQKQRALLLIQRSAGPTLRSE